MQWKNSAEEYGAVAKFLHWGMALAVIGMLALGLYMDALPLGPGKLELYGIHKAIGALILGFVVIRLGWRLINVIPPLPLTMPKWEKLAADASHYSLYALLFAMPMTGWLLSSAAGFPVSVFGWFTLPNLISPDPELREFFGQAHGVIAYALIGLIGLHAAAALKHHFIEKDSVLRRMLPTLVLLLLPLAANAQVPSWKVDKEKSTLSFIAIQNNAPIEGTFREYEADIRFDPTMLSQSHVRVVVKLGSVNTSYADVAASLKTADWFDVNAFPEAVFEASKFTEKGGHYTAEGTLTLRDKTLPVTLTFKLLEYTAIQARVQGEATISRGAFGVGRGEWEKNDSVKDEVKITFNLLAAR